MSLLDNMPHKCIIQRITKVEDNMMGNRDVPVEEQDDVRCWEQQVSAAEVLEYEKRGMSINTKVFFTSNPNVTERHQIVITERNGTAIAVADRSEMDVVAVPEPDASAGMGVVWRVMCYKSTGADD
ncbi:unnamed protein product [marine sediment metagenome]|uniref:Uncharacterized protein n=1 Tax=marine sediment metagenome TaxID=412755 RepID=X0YZ78_9ZZZZ